MGQVHGRIAPCSALRVLGALANLEQTLERGSFLWYGACMSSAKTPTTVFTGFLGSGKTTIITHLIDQLQKDQQVIYIKNEIGAENVDGALLEGKNIKSKELLNGCICCTLVGPFASAIDEILDTMRPDRILIEASGAADPSAIALMIDGHPRLTRDGIIAIIDVVNFDGYKDLSLAARNQTKFTDLVVFNKIELVDLETKRAVVDHVRELNASAPILEAPNGVLPLEVVFGIARPELISQLQLEEAKHVRKHDHPHHHHLEVDGLDSLAFTLTNSVDQATLESVLSTLPETVFRVKGIVQSESGMLLINRVGSRTTIETVAQAPTTKLVLIGWHLKDQKELIREKLAALIG